MLSLYAQSISPLFFVILFFKLQFPCSHCMPKVSRLYFSLSYSSSCSFHARTICPKYLTLFFVILFFKLQFPCSHCMPKVSRLCFSLSYSSSCSFHARTICPKYLTLFFVILFFKLQFPCSHCMPKVSRLYFSLSYSLSYSFHALTVCPKYLAFVFRYLILQVAVSMLALYAQSISPLFFVILFFKLQFPCSHCMPKVSRLCFSLSYSSSNSFHALTVCPKYLAFVFRYLILQVAVSMLSLYAQSISLCFSLSYSSSCSFHALTVCAKYLAFVFRYLILQVAVSMLSLYAQSISPLFFVILFFKLQFPCSHCMPKVSRLCFSLSYSSSCSFHALTVCPKYLAFVFRYLILQVAVSMLSLYAQSISPLFFVILFFKLQFPCSHCMRKVSRLCFSLSYSSSYSFHALTVCPKYLAFVFRYLILQVAVSMLVLYAQSISPLFFVILFFKLQFPCSYCMPKVSRLCFSLSYSSSYSFHAPTVCPKYLAFVFRYLILQVTFASGSFQHLLNFFINKFCVSRAEHHLIYSAFQKLQHPNVSCDRRLTWLCVSFCGFYSQLCASFTYFGQLLHCT